MAGIAYRSGVGVAGEKKQRAKKERDPQSQQTDLVYCLLLSYTHHMSLYPQ